MRQIMTNLEEFWNFVGAWFPDADLEGVDDDEQVVRNFVATKNHGRIEQVYLGCREVLAMDPLPVDRITDDANRYFENEMECREWLNKCLAILADAVAA
jgi:hypothetical protein